MRLAGYIRVSKVMGREGNAFHSPDLQRQQIEQWAALRGVEISEWFTDLDQSGGKIDRPAFEQALQRVESRDVDGIAVAKLDRFARSVPGAYEALKRIQAADGVLSSVAEAIDPTTPFGKFSLTVMLAMGELELDRITDNWKAIRKRVNDRGVHQSRPPFGYERGPDGVLVPSVHAPLLKELFQRRAIGESWTALATWLNTTAARPKLAAVWTPRVLKTITRNDAYLGVARHGEFRNENAHEALVSPALFEAAKGEMLGQSVSAKGNLLASLCRCAGCSYRMACQSYVRDGNKRRQYRCKKYHGSGKCEHSATIDAPSFEPWVIEQFFSYVGDMQMRRLPSESIDYVAAQEAVEAAERALVEFRDDPDLLHILGREKFLEGMKVRMDALTLAERERQRLIAEASELTLPDAASLKAAWDGHSTEDRRKLLGAAIDAIFIRTGRGDISERVRILWRGQAPADLPSRGKSAPMRPYTFAPDTLPASAVIAAQQA